MCSDADSFLTHDVITKRERELLAVLMQGLTNQDITKIMQLNRQTVRNYVHTIYQKFHVNSRYELFLLLTTNTVGR